MSRSGTDRLTVPATFSKLKGSLAPFKVLVKTVQKKPVTWTHQHHDKGPAKVAMACVLIVQVNVPVQVERHCTLRAAWWVLPDRHDRCGLDVEVHRCL